MTATAMGQPLTLPPNPVLRTSEVMLSPGQTLPRAQGLLHRYAFVQQGQLQVGHGDAASRVVPAGTWVVDDGRDDWRAASDGGSRSVRLVVMEHVASAPRVTGTGPVASAISASASAATPGVQSREVLRTTTDYEGKPIAMPEGPLRLMAYRYDIDGGAQMAWHLHGSPRYGYVEQGRIEVEDATGGRRVFGPGDMIVEQRGVWHRGMNPDKQPVSLLVLDIMPRDESSNTVLWKPDATCGTPSTRPDRTVSGRP